MLYTVTLSPFLDRIVEVGELVYDDVNEIAGERRYAGGKGIDVCRVIKELGGESTALGLAGGYNGLELVGRLIDEATLCDFTRIHDETRAHIIIFQKKKKIETLLGTPWPIVSEIEADRLLGKIREIPAGSFVVLSGPIPQGVSDSFYAEVIATLKEKDVKVVLDADMEALVRGTDAGPYLIKPNIHEFGRLVGENLTGVEEIIEHARPYADKVKYTVVSMGAKGAVGISDEGNFHVAPPKIRVRSSFGAGDSLVAGVVFGLSSGHSFEDALTLGVAAGTASALSAGHGLCTRDEIEAIKKDVVIEKF
ncbi:MAG TPA: 1-phosphofructokinase family hexose kinase [Syntrophorhabdaceae bacterium]|nr:1-phosphofructokinase family hexose kinase [Syntrophorhabdaceae bacterium]